jgi:hypothetical protein
MNRPSGDCSAATITGVGLSPLSLAAQPALPGWLRSVPSTRHDSALIYGIVTNPSFTQLGQHVGAKIPR